MTVIRTTIEPLREIDVSDAELTDMRRRGVILETRAKTDDGLIAAALRQTGAVTDDPPADPAPAPRPRRPRAARPRRTRAAAAAPADGGAPPPDAGATADGTTPTDSDAPSGQSEES
jgi:hypothetical protein